MTVSDVMTCNPESVSSVDTVQVALQKMLELEVRHLPVVDEGDLVGILSDRDLQASIFSVSELLEDPALAASKLNTPVSEFMVRDVITIDTETDLLDAIDLLLEHKIGALPVLDATDSSLAGIVSYVDVLRLARDKLS